MQWEQEEEEDEYRPGKMRLRNAQTKKPGQATSLSGFRING
jgi:hypothetical protein